LDRPGFCRWMIPHDPADLSRQASFFEISDDPAPFVVAPCHPENPRTSQVSKPGLSRKSPVIRSGGANTKKWNDVSFHNEPAMSNITRATPPQGFHAAGPSRPSRPRSGRVNGRNVAVTSIRPHRVIIWRDAQATVSSNLNRECCDIFETSAHSCVRNNADPGQWTCSRHLTP
jgi:hypothetical protein